MLGAPLNGAASGGTRARRMSVWGQKHAGEEKPVSISHPVATLQCKSGLSSAPPKIVLASFALLWYYHTDTHTPSIPGLLPSIHHWRARKIDAEVIAKLESVLR